MAATGYDEIYKNSNSFLSQISLSTNGDSLCFLNS